MFINLRSFHRLCGHGRHYVRRLHSPGFDLNDVKRDTIDEGAVPFVLRIEVRAETSIDENVDDISERKEKVEVEAVNEQRQNVLRSNTFEANRGAVPILVQLFEPLQAVIVSVFFRKVGPQLVNELQGFRPALMAVAADHVVVEEVAVFTERGADLIEQEFQFHE